MQGAWGAGSGDGGSGQELAGGGESPLWPPGNHGWAGGRVGGLGYVLGSPPGALTPSQEGTMCSWDGVMGWVCPQPPAADALSLPSPGAAETLSQLEPEPALGVVQITDVERVCFRKTSSLPAGR